MKLFLLIMLTLSLNADVDEFSKILEENKKTYSVYYNYDPFGSSKKVELTKKRIIKKNIYKLEAIFNNSVKINNNWYTSKIDGFNINIDNNKVKLNNGKEVIILEIKSKF